MAYIDFDNPLDPGARQDAVIVRAGGGAGAHPRSMALDAGNEPVAPVTCSMVVGDGDARAGRHGREDAYPPGLAPGMPSALGHHRP